MLKLPVKQQIVFLPAFLAPELVDRFHKAQHGEENWQSGFRKSFIEKTSLNEDLEEAMAFKK